MTLSTVCTVAFSLFLIPFCMLCLVSSFSSVSTKSSYTCESSLVANSNIFLVLSVTTKNSTSDAKAFKKVTRVGTTKEEASTKIGVRLENLTKIFSVSGHEKRVAVNNLTLDFHVGEVTALLGHNGAGKSTMM